MVTGILNVAKKDLNLKVCLKGGMSFRWSLVNEQSGVLNDELEFNGIIGQRIYFLKQIPAKDLIEYKVYAKKDNLASEDKIENELRDYFRLNEDLNALYSEWSKKDTKFNQKVTLHPDVLSGIRVLRLDPIENLFSFICSSNNNIKRITQMVSNMCIHFGELIGSLNSVDYYSFPSIQRLSEKDVEDKLRKLSFGYRAKYINQAAIYLKKNFPNTEDLFQLRTKPYAEVALELVKIPGIGKKVIHLI